MITINGQSAIPTKWRPIKYLLTTIGILLQDSIFVMMDNSKRILKPEEGDYYLTPEGYRCFTEQYHLKRGYCCESGCRHCPYGYDKKTNKYAK